MLNRIANLNLAGHLKIPHSLDRGSLSLALLRTLLLHTPCDAARRYPTRSRRPDTDFFIDGLLVWIRFITVMTRRTGLAPWELDFPFPESLTSTFLVAQS